MRENKYCKALIFRRPHISHISQLSIHLQNQFSVAIIPPPYDPYIYAIRTHKMALYKYFKKTPSALSNSNGSLSGRMPPEAISSANCEMLALVHQDTRQNSKTINTTRGQYASFSTTKSLSSSVASQSLSRC